MIIRGNKTLFGYSIRPGVFVSSNNVFIYVNNSIVLKNLDLYTLIHVQMLSAQKGKLDDNFLAFLNYLTSFGTKFIMHVLSADMNM